MNKERRIAELERIATRSLAESSSPWRMNRRFGAASGWIGVLLLLPALAAAQANLTITKTDDRTSVTPGERQSYVITVNNAGPADVEGAQVTDVLPADIFDVTWTCSAAEGPGLPSRFPFVESEHDGTTDNGLAGASAVAVSPDGTHVYATGLGDDAVAIFTRSPGASDSSHLTFQSVVRVTGALDGPSAIAVSPDGWNVYATGVNDHSLVVFNRSGNSLGVLEQLHDDENGVDGLRGASGIALDVDGDHVYVAARHEAAVAVFARAADGRLTFLEYKLNGIDDVAGMVGASGVAVSPDGAHVVGGGRFEDALVVFERQPEELPTGAPNPDYGRLDYLETLRDGVAGAAGLDEPVAIDFSPDGAHLYVASASDNAVAVYRRENDSQSPDFGLLSFQQMLVDGFGDVDGLARARAVAVSPDGIQVYAVGEDDDALAIFGRNDDPESPDYGRLSFLEVRRDGVDGVDGLQQAYGVAASSDRNHVYVAGFGDNALAAFRRRVSSRCTSSGSGNVDDTVDVAAGGTLTYVLEGWIDPRAEGTLVNTATIGGVQAQDTSTLTPVADLTVTKTNAADTVIAGDPVIYTLKVANGGPSRARDVRVVDVLDPAFFGPDPTWICRGAGSGNLDFQGTRDGLAQPRAAAVSDDGRYVYVTELAAGRLAVFQRDPATGDLGTVPVLSYQDGGDDGSGNTIAGLAGAGGVTLSPDGNRLYVSGQSDDALAVFVRDPADGSLTFQQVFRDGVDGVDGLAQAGALAASGDDLYVAGANDHAVAWFRDSAGTLSFQDVYRNGEDDGSGNTIAGLAGASDVAISADGANLYASGNNENAVAVFSRDPATGALRFEQSQSPPELSGASAVALDPGDGNVYVAAASALVVFARDPDNAGSIHPIQILEEGVGGVSGVAGAGDVLVFQDSHVYVTSRTGDAISHFERDRVNGLLTFVGLVQNGVDGVDGLDGVRGLAMADDDLYATGFEHGALAIFEVALDSDCPPGGTGDVDATVTIGAGSEVVFTIAAQVLPGVAGVPCTLDLDRRCIRNTASVLNNPQDPAPDDNAATDEDFIARVSELEITKVDDVDGFEVAAGEEVGYVITVTNHGPSDVEGAEVLDVFPMILDDVAWTCTTTGPADDCGAFSTGAGDVEAAVDVGAGSAVTFDATTRLVSGAEPGTLENRASVRVPAGFVDLDLGNNTAVAAELVITRQAELGITKTYVGPGPPVAGAPMTYQIVVDNAGPSDAPGTLIEDVFSEALRDVGWQCDPEPAPGLLGFAHRVVETAPPRLGVTVIAVSSEGLDLYAFFPGDDAQPAAVAQYRRDRRTGTLSWVRELTEGSGVDGLEGAAAAVVGPGDAQLYVAAERDDAVAVFDRDPLSGELTFRELHADGVDGVNGVDGARDLALSPDGAHLYVTGAADSGLAVFSRDPESGALSFVETFFDGVGGVDGLAGASGVALSPDGAFVYASGENDHAVAAFSRSPLTGRLTFLAELRDGADGVNGLAGARGLALSPDGEILYVAGAGAGAVAVLDRNPADGTLSFAAGPSNPLTDPALAGVRQLVTSADGREIYTASGGIAILRRDPESGQLALVQAVAGSADLQPPPAASFDFTGAASLTLVDDRHLVVADPAGDAIVVLERLAGPRCSATGSGHIRDLVNVTAGGRVTYTATGTLVASADGEIENLARVVAGEGVSESELGNNTSVVTNDVTQVSDLTVTKELCAREPASGALTCPGAGTVVAGEEVSFVITVGNAGPSEAAFTVLDLLPLYDPGTGTGAFVPGSISWSCGVDSALEPITVHRDGESGVDGLAAVADVALTPDGGHLLVASPGDDAVTVFRRLPGGGLSWQQVVKDGDPQDPTVDGLAGAEGVAVSPGGEHVYVASAAAGALSLFERQTDPQSPDYGDLTFVEALFDDDPGMDGLAGTARVIVSRDGAFVYATGEDDNAVVVFARDPVSGRLILVERERNGLGGVPFLALDGAHALVLSPDLDQSRLYVGAQFAAAITVFDRDPISGELSFREVVRNGDVHEDAAGPRTVQGLELVRGLALSPYGGYLYAASLEGDSLVVFGHGDDGECGDRPVPCLLFSERYPGLDGMSDVEITADGQVAYAAVRNRGEIAVFRRDSNSGALVLRETFAGDGLEGVRALTLAPDGTLYAAAEIDDALSAWRPLPEALCAGGTADQLAEDVFLVPGAEVTFTVTGMVDSAAYGQLVNTAGADLDGDGIADVTSAPLVETIRREADLTITKDDGTTRVNVGGPVTYTITVTNPGPSDIPGATVEDPPAGFPLPELNDATWTCTAADGAACGADAGSFPISEIVDLPAGSSLTYTLQATVAPTASTTLTNTAAVGVSDGATERDPTDNVAGDTDNVIAFVDLAVTKTNGLDQVVPGQEVTYTIEVSNAAPGATAATAAIVRDVVPSILNGVTWSCADDGAASCGDNPGGSGAIDERVTLPVGSTLTYTVRATVDPAAEGNLVNTVTVTPAAPLTDPSPANDTATDADPLTPEADLGIGIAKAGCGRMVYTVTVWNVGPSDARGLTLAATLPDEVTLTDIGGCAEEPPPGEAGCALGTLAAGASVVVTISVDADFGVSGVPDTVVEVSSDTTEVDPSDNTARVENAVDPACILFDGFESGDLSAWSDVAGGDGSIPLRFAASLAGAEWAKQSGLGRVPSLWAGFRLDASGAELAPGVHHTLFAGYNAHHQPLFGLEIGQFDGGPEILAWVRGDGEGLTSEWSPLAACDQRLEVEWWSGDLPAGDGLRVWLGGVLIAELTGVANGGPRCGFLRLGVLSAVGPESRGSYVFSDFHWHSGR